MLLLTCPHCGPRDETEFTHGGEAGRTRPHDADGLDDAAWADFLFMRRNERGLRRERWCHSAGCRRWFNITRSTVTHEIVAENFGATAPAPTPGHAELVEAPTPARARPGVDPSTS